MEHSHRNDQRSSIRVTTDASAFLSYNGQMIPGRIKNVSADAFCLAIELPLAVGTLVRVVIKQGTKWSVISGHVTRRSTKEIVVSSEEKSLVVLRAFYRSLLAA